MTLDEIKADKRFDQSMVKILLPTTDMQQVKLKKHTCEPDMGRRVEMVKMDLLW